MRAEAVGAHARLQRAVRRARPAVPRRRPLPRRQRRHPRDRQGALFLFPAHARTHTYIPHVLPSNPTHPRFRMHTLYPAPLHPRLTRPSLAPLPPLGPHPLHWLGTHRALRPARRRRDPLARHDRTRRQVARVRAPLVRRAHCRAPSRLGQDRQRRPDMRRARLRARSSRVPGHVRARVHRRVRALPSPLFFAPIPDTPAASSTSTLPGRARPTRSRASLHRRTLRASRNYSRRQAAPLRTVAQWTRARCLSSRHLLSA
jgi:hypothetical protein